MSRLAWMTSLLVPADLLHEATHMVAAWPYAAGLELERTRIGAAAHIEWTAGTPMIWIRISHLAPTIIGSIMGVLAVLFLPVLDQSIQLIGTSTATMLGVPDVSDEMSLLVALSLLVNYVEYVWPSQGDLRPFETMD